MRDAMPSHTVLPAASVESLVTIGLPLVHYAVNDLSGRVPRHVPRDELVSAGMLGLAQAAKSWDASRGVSFERYARTRIQGALLDELRSRDWATRSVRANARRLRAAEEELTVRTGNAPSAADVGRELGVSKRDVEKLNDDIHRATVLHYDAMFIDLDEAPACPLSDDRPLDSLVERELIGYLRDAVISLPERLRKVVVEYFFEERQMQDIADDLGVTESRVSQMRGEAIALLRASVDAFEGREAPGSESAPSGGRAAKRTAAYLAEVAAASDYKMRISRTAPGVETRFAAVSA